MEEKLASDEQSPEQKKTGSGAILASARKQQNRTVEEIAAELNLSVTQIKTIELDQSEGLPEPTYVRGYIRSYAKLLGLVPEKVLESYLNANWQKSSSLEDLPKGLGRADHGDSGSGFSFAKALILLLVLALLGYLWMTGTLTNLVTSSPTDSALREPAGEEITSPSDVDNAATNFADAALEQPDEALASAPEAVGENQLVLNFAQTSWVDIRDADDNRLAYKSYAQGEQLTVSSENAMSVFIGNADGVSAQYNGEDFDITPYREGVYAKFNLGED